MDWSLLNESAERVAPRLIGSLLVREWDGVTVSGRIVETEAYSQNDAASHSYRGRTARTDVMFGPSGYLYVYFTYGMHYCMNVVCGEDGVGAAVLIRAIEPLKGVPVMTENRNHKTGTDLTNGPAKLCQALGIDKQWNGHDLRQEPFRLILRPALQRGMVVQTTRICIAQAKDVPWRFYERGNQYVSKQ